MCAKELQDHDGAFKATPEAVKEYFRLFVNRRAYTLQYICPHPESGRHYIFPDYFRPTERKTGSFCFLTEQTIRQHLEGANTIGFYAINPFTHSCKSVAIDADYKNAMEDLLNFQYYLWQDKVETALEMSKRGDICRFCWQHPCLPRIAESTFTILLSGWECR